MFALFAQTDSIGFIFMVDAHNSDIKIVTDRHFKQNPT